jgi:hypothetical protein
VGRQLSRLLREREHDRRPPGAEGGLAPGSGHDLFMGDDSFPTAFMLAANFGFA